MRSVPTWLPAELVVAQPYSMGPVTDWSPPMPHGITTPCHGTVREMDDERCTGGLPSGQMFSIWGMFIARRIDQQDPKRSITMFYASGLLEHLGLTPEDVQQGSAVALRARAAERLSTQQRGPQDQRRAEMERAEQIITTTLADLLAAHDDEGEDE